MTDSMRVLYVDEPARDDVLAAFESIDATVEHVTTLSDCLAALERDGCGDAISCVVAEQSLPDATGATVPERIRATRADVPLVIFTGAGTEALAGELVAAGIDGYVPESQGIDTLVTRVIEAVVDREQDRDRQYGHDRANPVADGAGAVAVDLDLEDEGDTTEVRDGAEDADEADETRDANDERANEDENECERIELERADALEALEETTHELMRANSIAEIAAIAVETAETVLEQPRASVRLYDEDADHLAVVATSAELERVTEDEGLPPIGPNDGLFWETYERREPVIVEDPVADVVPFETKFTVGSIVVHPLGDHGILTVGAPGGGHLDGTDLHLVSVLAATVEAALDRAVNQRELERAKTIVETVGDVVYALDAEGYIVSINETFAAITGYSRDELLGEHVSLVLTDESLERGRREIAAALASDDERVATYELTVVPREGEPISCEVNTTVLQSDGEFAGTVGVVRDISERKAMERELRKRKEKTTALHEVVSTLEQCETARAIYREAVDAAMRVLNFDVCVIGTVEGEGEDEDQVEELHTRAVAPSEYAAVMPDRAPADGIAGRAHRTRETHRIGDVETSDDVGVRSDTVDATFSKWGIRSVLTVPIGEFAVFQAVSTDPDAFDRHDRELAELLVSHVSDALERLTFESRLREERDRFAALFENVPDAVVSVRHREDGAPIVERVNPAFERIFGYDEGELRGESLDRFIVPTDRAPDADVLNRRGSSGEIVEAEVKRRTADGLRDFMMRIVPMGIDATDSYSFGVYTDVTEQKQRQKRVEILNRVLRHDLRNGMNIINGCAEMLGDVVDDTSQQYADAIQERAGELIGLAEKTRAVERTLERGKAATGPVDVVGSIEEAVERVEAEHASAQVSVSLPDYAHARANDMLEAAIYHVVENAAEHNDMPVATIDVAVVETDETLLISVADNGPGVPDDERALLQEEKEITQLRHASGLGLWLVNWVVTQSGGVLSFDENDPRGTIVTLEVPKAEAPTAQAIGDGATVSD